MHRTIEGFLAARPIERGLCLAAAFATVIAGLAVIPKLWQWTGLQALCGAVVAAGLPIDRDGDAGHLKAIQICLAPIMAAGCLAITNKSALVGQAEIAWPAVAMRSAGSRTARAGPGVLQAAIAMAEASFIWSFGLPA